MNRHRLDNLAPQFLDLLEDLVEAQGSGIHMEPLIERAENLIRAARGRGTCIGCGSAIQGERRVKKFCTAQCRSRTHMRNMRLRQKSVV